MEYNTFNIRTNYDFMKYLKLKIAGILLAAVALMIAPWMLQPQLNYSIVISLCVLL
jgi:hypothetical protein